MVPKVVMKGLIPSRVTRLPLPQPTAAPVANAASIASGTGRCALFMASAATSPQTAIAEPTDMSKAPQMMTMHIPITIEPSGAAFSRIVTTVSTSRNCRFRAPNTPTAKMTEIRIVSSRIRNRRRVSPLAGRRGSERGIPGTICIPERSFANHHPSQSCSKSGIQDLLSTCLILTEPVMMSNRLQAIRSMQ